MQKFSDNLLTLDNADHVKRIELFDEQSRPAGQIENKPGTQGSIKVYHHLFKIYGEINSDAAVEGLALYAEHTEDAENHPGKHPNIDRLLTVLDKEQTLSIKVVSE
ncbi:MULTISPECIES: DUF2322 family protein [unclassified Methylophilus]|uniref:DUF2322 family protein n=1 Tax=unclassified Methylophilus TaxID=2630143 RepID=UPI0006FC6F80|nr:MULTISPECIES: DUF2322 family protein [unclassified Methylophilus]KQT42288.1 hypothetical protein ASG34_05895 [Methylophilus sp. Leaf416]KQT56470.1 hypothetical protein ASG44_05870 [Methylophilus sp. Leaf459]